MKKLIIAIALFAASSAVFSANISDNDIKTILSVEDTLNSMCRGGSGDDPRTEVACEEREKLVKVLGHLNWCYGEKGQAGFEMKWHKCTSNSNR